MRTFLNPLPCSPYVKVHKRTACNVNYLKIRRAMSCAMQNAVKQLIIVHLGDRKSTCSKVCIFLESMNIRVKFGMVSKSAEIFNFWGFIQYFRAKNYKFGFTRLVTSLDDAWHLNVFGTNSTFSNFLPSDEEKQLVRENFRFESSCCEHPEDFHDSSYDSILVCTRRCMHVQDVLEITIQTQLKGNLQVHIFCVKKWKRKNKFFSFKALFSRKSSLKIY